MKKICLVVLGLLFGLMSAHATDVTYTVDNTTIFPNPERGFLHQRTRHTGKDYHALVGKDSELDYHAQRDNVSLILVLYYLDEFNKTPILPDSVLKAFDEDMQVLRNHGMKAIFRIAYAEYDDGQSGSERSAHDAPLYIIQQHLAQYKPYWEKNADVIFTFQAGFVGQYGEWYYTDNFGNHVPSINDSCRLLLDTALKAIPQNRTLLLRRPMFKMEYLDGVALTEEEAYTGTPKARLGHFNDAFLYNADNMGTYSTNETKRAAQKALIAQETLYVPIGGETDITNQAQAEEQASLAATTEEMSTMHWTFIKNSYSEVVTNMWRENHTFDTLNMYMGYRYQLVNATLPEEAKAGDEVAIALNIKNVGYAPLYNERPAYLVLKNDDATYPIELEADPRTWLPNGVVSSVEEQISLPQDIPAGTYQLYLHLPDAYESLAEDPRYAVRFANANVWDAETGMNSLNASLTIKGAVTPDPDPDPEPVAVDTVALPDILNAENYADCTEGLTMYNTDFFDLGPTDAPNLDNWVEWRVELKYPGEYTITEVSACPNSHQFALLLMDGNTVVATDTLKKLSKIHGADTTVIHNDKWNLYSVPTGVYSLRVKNVAKWGQPKLKSLTLDCNIPAEAVILPGTLNKENVSAVSDEKWYNTDYFNFGDSWGVDDSDGHNLSRWIEWQVELKYPGEYIISEAGYYPNGHNFTLQLLKAGTEISTFTTAQSWAEGEKTITQTEKWDLSSVAKGVYALRVKNATDYGQPKLKSLTLEYDGELPTGIETPKDLFNGQAFDILGRPVGNDYHGIVIQNGKKRLQ